MWSAFHRQARLCSDALQELRVEQERDALWTANQVYFEEYRQKEEKRTQEEVRPDFAVCCAGVTVRRDYLAASQKLRREQERAAAWAASRPDFVVLLCRQAYVLMLCRHSLGY